MKDDEMVFSLMPAAIAFNGIDFRREWDSLNAYNSNMPFLDSVAVKSSLKYFGSGQEKVLVGALSGCIKLAIVVTPCGMFRWQTFQPSQIPLGIWVTDLGSEFFPALQKAIKVLLPNSWLVFSLLQLDPRFYLIPDSSRQWDVAEYIQTAWIDLVGTYEDYMANRGKNLRQNLRKQRKKLETEGRAFQIKQYSSLAEVPQAVSSYGMLEAKGWKSKSGTAISPSNAQGDFYAELLSESAKKGEAYVYEGFFGDQLVASNLCLGREGTLTILKTTYDESVQPFSPAFLLTEELIESFYLSKQWIRIEFYGRVMEWHTKWTHAKRPLHHMTLHRVPMLRKLRRLAASRSNS